MCNVKHNNTFNFTKNFALCFYSFYYRFINRGREMYIIRFNEKLEIVYFAYFIPRTQHVHLTDYKTKICIRNKISLYSST